MPITTALISGGISAGTSLYGASQAKEQAEAAAKERDAIIQASLDELNALGYPPEEALRITLETPELVGKLVPHLQSQLPDLKSAASEIKSNPKLEEAQLDALDSLQERAQGGLNAQDRADIEKVKRESMSGLAGQDANIIQNMEQRGLGGGGAELAMRLNAKSQAQSQASEESDRLAAQNYNAKMAALQGAGNMAGSMQQADFGRQMQKSQSQDAIAKFNQANAYNVNSSNAAAMNRGDEQNLSAAQTNANQGSALRNQQQMYNKNLKVNEYNAKLDKIKAKNAVRAGQAANAATDGTNQAANTSTMWNAIGDVAGSVIDASTKKKP